MKDMKTAESAQKVREDLVEVELIEERIAPAASEAGTPK